MCEQIISAAPPGADEELLKLLLYNFCMEQLPGAKSILRWPSQLARGTRNVQASRPSGPGRRISLTATTCLQKTNMSVNTHISKSRSLEHVGRDTFFSVLYIEGTEMPHQLRIFFLKNQKSNGWFEPNICYQLSHVELQSVAWINLSQRAPTVE